MHKLLKLISPFIFVLVFLVLSPRQTVQAADPAGFGKATVWWNGYNGAVKYRIYYKEASEKTWTHAARGIMEPARSFTIEYLKNGVTYNYQVVAVKDDGTEIWFTPVRSFWSGSGMRAQAKASTWTVATTSAPVPTQPTTSGSWTSSTASWTWQADADTYNVYYREAGQKGYAHAVPGVPSNGTSVRINGLKNGVMYYYNVAVVKDGREIRWLGEKPLTWAWRPQAQVITLNKNFTRTTTPPIIQRPSPVMQKYNNGGY